MEENTTYKKFVYLILKLLFMLLLLGALFYFWQNMPLAVLLSFSIGVVAISCSFVVEFFGFDQKKRLNYTPFPWLFLTLLFLSFQFGGVQPEDLAVLSWRLLLFMRLL